jgi:hypothetical protein
VALLGIAVTLVGGVLVVWAASSTAGLRRTRGESAALVVGLALAVTGVAAAVVA